jgi:hypothetical protein
MAATEKKDYDAKLDADPRDQLSPAAKKFLKSNSDIDKVIGKFKYSEKVSLDPRKWSKKDLESGVLAVALYEIKIFAVRINEIAKSGKADKSVVDEVKKLHAKTQKYIDKKLSLAVDELANDKGDNKKGLKDCKAAFDKLARIDFDDIYSIPRSMIEGLFNDLGNSLDDADEKQKAKYLADALKELGEAQNEFEKTGKAAEGAVDTLIKAAKTTKANKDVDPEFAAYADIVLKQEGKITSVLDNMKKFSAAVGTAEKVLKSKDLDAKQAKDQARVFKGMSNLDGSAKDTLKSLSKLETDFDKIAKKLK